MIGGIDTHIPTRVGDLAVEVAVRAVRQHWPDAVFEHGDTGDKYDEFWQIPFGELNEIFVYRDPIASQRWDAEGAVPEVYNTMVHIIADEGMITLVVDEKDAAMQQLIATISSALDDDILYMPALLEAA
jgi:hypothetical protein